MVGSIMRLKRNLILNYAHKCVLPSCENKISYHRTWTKQDNTIGVKWKNFCEYHRRNPLGRQEKEEWMIADGGCENRDSRLGFKCTDPLTSLTVDHWDGNKRNTDPGNLVRLCANCHNFKTKDKKDYLNSYTYANPNFERLFKYV